MPKGSRGWPLPALAVLTSLVVLTLLAWRLTLVTDLNDEAYYLAFTKDWLQGGIGNSPLLMLHQTAALVVHPAALLHHAVVGGIEGLALLMRCVFLLGSALSALVWWLFLRPLTGAARAWAVVLCVLCFIPFGIATASYNTLGLQGLLVAMAAYGIVATRPDRRAAVWRWVSAAAAAVATVSYPPLALALCVPMIDSLTLPAASLRRRGLYCATVLACQLLAWLLVVLILTWPKFLDVLAFTWDFNDVGGLGRKVAFSRDVLLRAPVVTVLFAVSGLAGLFRSRLTPAMRAGVLIALAVALQTQPPALFVKSHDLLTALALTGLGLLSGLSPTATPRQRVFAVLYATGMLAGLVTACTGFNGVYNFAICGAAAAFVVLAALRDPAAADGRTSVPAFAATVVAAGLLLHSALTELYGRWPGEGVGTRMRGNVFAGITVPDSQRPLHDFMRRRVVPLLGPDGTIVVFGRVHGLSLLTDARLLAPITFPLYDQSSPAARRLLRAFYQVPRNQPDVVVIFEDQYLDIENPFGDAFGALYEPVATEGPIAVFVRRGRPRP